ncbi:hypothetical protein L4D06_23790 [Enterovibrio makurazakiensis]|uniref:hypothetical protein n=1 Tax=Enterovibrio makurazakiensis TaxID=2910232 RepID=UPI003D19F30A
MVSSKGDCPSYSVTIVTQTVELPDWIDTLETKGFKAMLEDWVSAVASGRMDEKAKQRNLSTHAFCEWLRISFD